MQYYEIIFDSNPIITGLKNGGFQVEINENGFADKQIFLKIKSFFMSLKYWEREDFIPNFDVNIESAVLKKGAKLTDFLHFAPHMNGCPFMISEKAYKLLEKFTLPNHYYWPVNIENVDSFLYKLFYIPYLGFEYIDFKNCLFYTGYELLGNIKFYELNSLEEFLNFKEDGILRIKELAFIDKFDRTWDMFNSRLGGLFISEKLKHSIENSNLSGINFLTSTKIKP